MLFNFDILFISGCTVGGQVGDGKSSGTCSDAGTMCKDDGSCGKCYYRY